VSHHWGTSGLIPLAGDRWDPNSHKRYKPQKSLHGARELYTGWVTASQPWSLRRFHAVVMCSTVNIGDYGDSTIAHARSLLAGLGILDLACGRPMDGSKQLDRRPGSTRKQGWAPVGSWWVPMPLR
jgi:hypothetical protein